MPRFAQGKKIVLNIGGKKNSQEHYKQTKSVHDNPLYQEKGKRKDFHNESIIWRLKNNLTKFDKYRSYRGKGIAYSDYAKKLIQENPDFFQKLKFLISEIGSAKSVGYELNNGKKLLIENISHTAVQGKHWIELYKVTLVENKNTPNVGQVFFLKKNRNDKGYGGHYEYKAITELEKNGFNVIKPIVAFTPVDKPYNYILYPFVDLMNVFEATKKGEISEEVYRRVEKILSTFRKKYRVENIVGFKPENCFI